MKNKTTTISNSLFVFNEETASAFNAVLVLFMLFSVFSLFTLFSLMITFLFGLEVNIMPVVIAFMLASALGITVVIVSYAIEATIKFRNNGE